MGVSDRRSPAPEPKSERQAPLNEPEREVIAGRLGAAVQAHALLHLTSPPSAPPLVMRGGRANRYKLFCSYRL